MGSVGDAYDNAMCENFFATLESSCFTAEDSTLRSRHGWLSSTKSKAGTTHGGGSRRYEAPIEFKRNGTPQRAKASSSPPKRGSSTRAVVRLLRKGATRSPREKATKAKLEKAGRHPAWGVVVKQQRHATSSSDQRGGPLHIRTCARAEHALWYPHVVSEVLRRCQRCGQAKVRRQQLLRHYGQEQAFTPPFYLGKTLKFECDGCGHAFTVDGAWFRARVILVTIGLFVTSAALAWLGLADGGKVDPNEASALAIGLMMSLYACYLLVRTVWRGLGAYNNPIV